MLPPRNYLFLYLVLIAALASTRIRAQGGTIVSQNRVRFLREPTDTTTSIGDDAELGCSPNCGESNRCLFSTWTHNGTVVNYSSRILKNSNGSLILKGIEHEQAGVYQCVVIVANYGVFLSRRAELRIARLGTLTEEPEDATDAVLNGAVRFGCAAETTTTAPSPNITWYHNGNALINESTNGRRTILSNGALQISKLQLSDEGSYGCVVSNMAGMVWSRNASLNISRDVSPSPTDVLKVIQAPENTTVVRNQTALFECVVQFGESLVWKRLDESPLSSKAYVVNGNLFIPDAQPSDEGSYACVVKATAGKSISLAANLIVEWPPVIVKAPEETKRYRGESYRFNCFTSAKPAPEIVWYKNGERLRSRGRFKMYPTEHLPPSFEETPSGLIRHVRDLLITSIEKEDTAVYQCMAENHLGSATAAAALIYQESVELGAPTNLSAVVLPNQKEIELSWHLPPEDLTNRTVIFIVHFHEVEAGSENTMAVKPEACEENTCKAICCSNINLSPFTNYTFWVDALVDYHQTAPRFTKPSEQIFVRSGDAAASAATPILLQETSRPDVIRLSWRQPSMDTIRGEITEFRLETKMDAVGGLAQWKPPIMIHRQRIDYLVDEIETGQVLYFRVIPRTRAGYPTFYPMSNFPWLRYQRARMTSGQRQNGTSNNFVDDAPSVSAQAFNATTVYVYWTPGAVRNPSGENPSKWIVVASRSNDPHWQARSDVDYDENSVVLFGLNPDTFYQITVYSSTPIGAEGRRATRLVRTLASSRSLANIAPISGASARMIVPYPIPHCKPAGPGQLLLTWDKPPMNTGIVLITLRYSLLPLDSDEALNVSAHVKTIETSDSQMIFTELLPGRMYLFATRAQTEGGYKSVYSHDINCSVPLATPLPPQQVEASMVNGSLVVRWTPVQVVEPGEPRILKYHVRYSATSLEDEWHEVVVPGSYTNVTISRPITVSSSYYVSVSAENEVGQGEESYMKSAFVNSLALASIGGTVATSASSTSNSNSTATVVLRTSYKEGVIIGVCIGILCVFMSAMVLILRSWRDQDGCIYRFFYGQHATGTKLGNGGAKTGGGHPNGEVHCVELKEMQTLLPQLMENTESDSKGADIGSTSKAEGSNGHTPRSSNDGDEERGNLIEKKSNHQSPWSQQAPAARVFLGSPISDRGRNVSPTTAILANGHHHPPMWTFDNNGTLLRTMNGDWKKYPPTSSMPDLLDLDKKRVLLAGVPRPSNGHHCHRVFDLSPNGPLRLIDGGGGFDEHSVRIMNGAPRNGRINETTTTDLSPVERIITATLPLAEKDIDSSPVS